MTADTPTPDERCGYCYPDGMTCITAAKFHDSNMAHEFMPAAPAPDPAPEEDVFSRSDVAGYHRRIDRAACLAPDPATTVEEALAGEVWQESDGVLMLCIEPGVRWRDFNGDNVPWDAPTIAHPMTRLLDAEGQLVDDRVKAAERKGARDALTAAADAITNSTFPMPGRVIAWLRARAEGGE